MTAQQAGGWTRRAFLRNLMLAGAAGVFGVYPRPVTPIELFQSSEQPDHSSGLAGCPQREARAPEICPNCCNPRYQAT
jgi:hypothetical protein